MCEHRKMKGIIIILCRYTLRSCFRTEVWFGLSGLNYLTSFCRKNVGTRFPYLVLEHIRIQAKDVRAKCKLIISQAVLIPLIDTCGIGSSLTQEHLARSPPCRSYDPATCNVYSLFCCIRSTRKSIDCTLSRRKETGTSTTAQQQQHSHPIEQYDCIALHNKA